MKGLENRLSFKNLLFSAITKSLTFNIFGGVFNYQFLVSEMSF